MHGSDAFDAAASFRPEANDRPTRIRVDLDALSHNFHALQAHAGVPVMGIVKANAYGHGLVPVARHLQAVGGDVGGDDMAGSGAVAHGPGHESEHAGPGDQDVAILDWPGHPQGPGDGGERAVDQREDGGGDVCVDAKDRRVASQQAILGEASVQVAGGRDRFVINRLD